MLFLLPIINWFILLIRNLHILFSCFSFFRLFLGFWDIMDLGQASYVPYSCFCISSVKTITDTSFHDCCDPIFEETDKREIWMCFTLDWGCICYAYKRLSLYYLSQIWLCFLFSLFSMADQSIQNTMIIQRKFWKVAAF